MTLKIRQGLPKLVVFFFQKTHMIEHVLGMCRRLSSISRIGKQHAFRNMTIQLGYQCSQNTMNQTKGWLPSCNVLLADYGTFRRQSLVESNCDSGDTMKGCWGSRLPLLFLPPCTFWFNVNFLPKRNCQRIID